MPRALASLTLCLLPLAPSRALAEASPKGSPVGAFTWSIGAGPSVPVFEASKHFPAGGQLNLGLGYHVLDRLTGQADYLYSNYGIMADILKPGNFNATHTVQAGNLNFLVSILPRSDSFDLYVVAGPGVYGRTIEITSIAGNPVPTFCDPALLLCLTSTAPAAGPLAKATKADPGLDAGFGMSFSLGIPVRLFLDVRAHFIWGTVNTPDGPRKANGQYIPISVGFRYF